MKHETTFWNAVPFNQLSKKDFGFHSIFSPKLAIFLEIGIFSVQNWLAFVANALSTQLMVQLMDYIG